MRTKQEHRSCILPEYDPNKSWIERSIFKKDFGNNRESLIAEIFEERRRELMGEGWRWYDLVRRQKLMKDNEAFLRLISSGGIYWPVSEDIITANSQIEQNEFWK